MASIRCNATQMCMNGTKQKQLVPKICLSYFPPCCDKINTWYKCCKTGRVYFTLARSLKV